MSVDHEAQRRIDQACDLIRSAFRLGASDPKQTIQRVRAAISSGAEQYAQDMSDEADSA